MNACARTHSHNASFTETQRYSFQLLGESTSVQGLPCLTPIHRNAHSNLDVNLNLNLNAHPIGVPGPRGSRTQSKQMKTRRLVIYLGARYESPSYGWVLRLAVYSLSSCGAISIIIFKSAVSPQENTQNHGPRPQCQ